MRIRWWTGVLCRIIYDTLLSQVTCWTTVLIICTIPFNNPSHSTPNDFYMFAKWQSATVEYTLMLSSSLDGWMVEYEYDCEQLRFYSDHYLVHIIQSLQPLENYPRAYSFPSQLIIRPPFSTLNQFPWFLLRLNNRI